MMEHIEAPINLAEGRSNHAGVLPMQQMFRLQLPYAVLVIILSKILSLWQERRVRGNERETSLVDFQAH